MKTAVISISKTLLAVLIVVLISSPLNSNKMIYAMDPPQYERAIPNAVVLIDVGHGGIDGGAYVGDILEKDINLAVARELYKVLHAQGIRTVMNRTSDYALSDDNRWHISRSRHKRELSQRKQLSEEITVRMFVSLHVNSTSNKSKKGPLVLHQDNGQSTLLAFFIQDALNRQQGKRTLPRLGKPFYLLRQVKQPAVIVEMGFISNAADRQMLASAEGQKRTAEAIAAGLRQYLLVTG
ncbi:N-acetylmuramoyl-L-alanine amidase [Paenibacillaceae bacterium]|nr:N-acetylmuramoyl-L-alanine amidase [Paenibacillaceae bacterium]